MKYVSICTPTYEMGGKGALYLRYAFDILTRQTFKDFEVVISDQSNDSKVKRVCDEFRDRLDVKYFRNEQRGNSSANANNAIRHAEGKIIKLFWQDDFLYGEDSLEKIVTNFDISKDHWMATACIHLKEDDGTYVRPLCPQYIDETILLKNTIGAPTVITFKNEDPVLFDETLDWSQDVDFYKRWYNKYGLPKIMKDTAVVIRMHPNQFTNVASAKVRTKDYINHLKKWQLDNPGKRMFAHQIVNLKRFIKRMLGIKKL